MHACTAPSAPLSPNFLSICTSKIKSHQQGVPWQNGDESQWKKRPYRAHRSWPEGDSAQARGQRVEAGASVVCGGKGTSGRLTNYKAAGVGWFKQARRNGGLKKARPQRSEGSAMRPGRRRLEAQLWRGVMVRQHCTCEATKP